MTAIASSVRPGGPGTTQARASAARAALWARRAPLLPALLFLIVITQLPFVATLVISLFSWNPLNPGTQEFVWFANYAQVLTDPTLRSAVLNTIILTVTVVLVSLVIGLGVALLLNRAFLGRGIVRTLMIAPFLVVPVAAALLWKHALFNPSYGLINGTLNGIWRLFGSDGAPQPDWISTAPKIAIEVSLIWQWTPFMMLILLAGLQSQPGDTLEAARVEGAGTWQIFRYLTFPHLRRYLELGGLLGAIYIVQNFDAVFTITSGGLNTANLPYNVYQTFYVGNEYGLASATGVIVVLFSIVLATFALRTVSSLFKQEA